MIQNKVSRLPLQRKLLPVLVIFLSITVISLALTFVALGIQSSVRAYVAGEGMWSKAQRDAVLQLQVYARTGDKRSLQKFEAAMVIPLGYRTARLTLLQPEYDRAAATEGLIAGKTDPDDIPGVIRLFRCCASLSYMRTAIDYWAEGDRYILKKLKCELPARSDKPTVVKLVHSLTFREL